MVDVVVLNYNDADTTIRFVEHVKDLGSVSHIMIVDNASTDDSAERLSGLTDGKVRLIVSDSNGGYGAGNNLGIRELYNNFGSEYILLSNPDVMIDDRAIEETERFLRANKEYAIAAPFMRKTDGTKAPDSGFRIVSAGEYILSLGMIYSKLVRPGRIEGLDRIDSDHVDVGALAGSCFMMDAGVMIRHGMYDENMFLFCEEVALGIRLRDAGYKAALLPNESFIHAHSVSINKSYRSEVRKKKMLVKSKLYVIRHYYKANRLQMFLAGIMAGISVAESAVMSVLKR